MGATVRGSINLGVTLRSIPSIEQLRQRQAMQELEATYGRAAVVDALRAEASAIRMRLAESDGLDLVMETMEAAVRTRLDADRTLARCRHQRDGRHRPHESRPGAARRGRHGASRRPRVWVYEPRIRPGHGAAVRRVTRMPSG